MEQRQQSRSWRWPLLLLLVTLLLPVALAAATVDVTLRGDFIQGGLVFGQTCPQCRVLLAERDVPVTSQGKFIIGFGRDALPQQELLVQTPDGVTISKGIAIQQREYRIQHIDGISRRMMQPSEEDLLRIQHEAQEVTTVRQISSDQDHFLEPFIWPLQGRITGVYGSQRIFNGEPRQPHYGIDIAAPSGTRITAPAGGVVTLAHPGMFFAGTTLVIDHGYGLSSTFLHLDEILAEPGQQVSRGEVIATVGKTGRVTGPHLDWRVNWFDTRLDPALLVGEMTD